MKKFRYVVLSVFSLLLSGMPVYAAEDNVADSSGSTATSPAVLEITPATFSVTVPTQVPMTYNADGTVTVPDNLVITNNSKGAVTVSDAAINGQNGWSVVDYDTLEAKLDNMKVDTHEIAFELNGAKTTGEGSLSGYTFNTINANGATEEITLSAIVGPQVTVLEEGQDTVANIVFTVDWYAGE